MLAEEVLTTTIARRAGVAVRSVVAITLIVWLSSCGGGSSGSQSSSDAVQKCQDLSQLQCERLVACGASPSVASCLAEIQSSADCDHAVGVTSRYSACMQDLSAMNCTDLLASGAWNLPNTCTGVILVP